VTCALAMFKEAAMFAFFDSLCRLTNSAIAGVLLRLLRNGCWIWIVQNTKTIPADSATTGDLKAILAHLRFAVAWSVVQHRNDQYIVATVQPTPCYTQRLVCLAFRQYKGGILATYGGQFLKVGSFECNVGPVLPHTDQRVTVPGGDLSLFTHDKALMDVDGCPYAVNAFHLISDIETEDVFDIRDMTQTVSVHACDAIFVIFIKGSPVRFGLRSKW